MDRVPLIYTFCWSVQAETEADRIDWMNKIRGVIASLLNSHLHQVMAILNMTVLTL